MRMRVALALPAAALAVGALACGGEDGAGAERTVTETTAITVTSSAPSSTAAATGTSAQPRASGDEIVTRDALVACFEGGLGGAGRVSTAADEVKGYLEGASRGGLTLYGPTTQVNIAVETSVDLAEARERLVEQYVGDFGSEDLFPVERRGNVVLQSSSGPYGPPEQRLIDACLPE